MGTRALTKVVDEYGRTLVCMYRQMDGYPSGHGMELAGFLNSKVLVNGYSDEKSTTEANGMECLAAQTVAHFKKWVGGIYLVPADRDNYDVDYEYTVCPDEVTVTSCKRNLFTGTWAEFRGWCGDEYQ